VTKNTLPVRRGVFSVLITIVAAACSSPSRPEPTPPVASTSPAAGGVPGDTSGADGGAGASSATASTAASTAPSSEPTPTGGGESDPQAALAAAKKDGKATFVVFCAKWVAACAELAHVLLDPGVKKTLDERFVVARVDVSSEDDPTTKDRMQKFKVKGLPFMIAYDRKGKEVARESGAIDATRVSKLLDKAK
jgi:thiol:disulfide interchange protein